MEDYDNQKADYKLWCDEECQDARAMKYLVR